MKPVVFLGPSLDLQSARGILDATYLPPARQADIISCVEVHKPSVVALIDGYFDQVLSVWHKEILYVLSRGIPVYGASSMGALRAVEMEPFGMVGVGEVFEMYKSGVATADDEVALRHGDASSGYLSLSMPLVNIRATLRGAERDGVIDRESRQRLLELIRDLHFPDRVPSVIERAAIEAAMSPETVSGVISYIESDYVDLKRQDAVLLLETLARLPVPPPRVRPTVDSRQHLLFGPLYERDRRVKHGDAEISLARIASYAALHAGEFAEVNSAALNRALIQVLAGFLDLTVSGEETEAESRRFRLRNHLTSEASLDDWIRRNDLTASEFRTLMEELAICRRLHGWLISRNGFTGTTRYILDELRLRNHYEPIARAAASEAAMVERHHPEFLESGHSGIELADLLESHLRNTHFSLDTDVETWAEEAGFDSVTDLKLALIHSRLARDVVADVLNRAWGSSETQKNPARDCSGDAGNGDQEPD